MEPLATEVAATRIESKAEGKPRVLILYEKMGMGHLRNAEILRDMLESELDVEVLCVAGSDIDRSPMTKAPVWLWNELLRRGWTRTADYLLNVFGRSVVLPLGEAVGVRAFLKKIEAIAPDVIFSTADVFNKGLGAYKAAKRIPFFIVLTESVVFADMLNPNAVHFCCFRETAALVRSADPSLAHYSHRLDHATPFIEKAAYLLGYWNDHLLHGRTKPFYRDLEAPDLSRASFRCRVLGPLAPRKFFGPCDIEQTKHALGLDHRLPVVLVAGGSIGGKVVRNATDALERSETPMTLCVMCGKDKGLYRSLRCRQNAEGMVKMLPFEYTEHFGDYLRVADCIVARPSASIFNESLLSRTPMVAFGRVTLNDRGAVFLIEKHGLGAVCRAGKQVVSAIDRLLREKDQYRRNIESFLASYPETYEEQMDIVVGEVRRACSDTAGESLHGVAVEAGEA